MEGTLFSRNYYLSTNTRSIQRRFNVAETPRRRRNGVFSTLFALLVIFFCIWLLGFTKGKYITQLLALMELPKPHLSMSKVEADQSKFWWTRFRYFMQWYMRIYFWAIIWDLDIHVLSRTPSCSYVKKFINNRTRNKGV